ncbi:MAG: DUF4339 domain-containing protein [Sandaracinaceae bacterium]
MMRWWVNRGGQPEGPFEQAQIADQLRVGQLSSTTQVAPESGGGWQPVSAVPEFASSLAIGQNPETAATMAVDSKSLFGPDGVPPPPTGSPIAGHAVHGAPQPGFGAAPFAPPSPAAVPTPAPLPGPGPGVGPSAGVPGGNPMVAGTMAMDSASLMQAAAASQAGLGLAPGYKPPTAGSAPGIAQSVPQMAPNMQFAAPQKPSPNRLPYLLLGCGALAFLVMICLAAGIIISRS